MLQFLATHARSITVALLLFIAAIGGYWLYDYSSKDNLNKEIESLGALLLINDAKTRLEQLEGFAAKAPASVKRQTWYSIMETASQLKDYGKAYTAWDQIRSLDANLYTTGTVGMADALSAQQKYKEALDLLGGIANKLNKGSIEPVNTRILALAEHLGDYSRAITACDAILGNTEDLTEISIWKQRKYALEQKAAAKK